ncbi:hypothetical protein K402DRAFT_415486 [Aulographum hederae CBS 113979]|uniref:G-patch domain-containing protein n=1 Tax=Aulographum hederae CBS 113979 TaxID=1176131 RepID=A0A6G1GKU0_9PEZI|nr:hypothetical protein K402DRAFT_415486 [Aulographum hederae CBS 113979]
MPPKKEEEEEVDYMTMVIEEPKVTPSFRPKKDPDRGRTKSKKQLEEEAAEAQKEAMATKIDSSNKGYKMLARMGFSGGALGRGADGLIEPIQAEQRDGRGGIGLDTEKKRKIAEATEQETKRAKTEADEYIKRKRDEVETADKERNLRKAQNIAEEMDTEAEKKQKAKVEGEKSEDASPPAEKRLAEIPVLYRSPVFLRRLQEERDRSRRSKRRAQDYGEDDSDEPRDFSGRITHQSNKKREHTLDEAKLKTYVEDEDAELKEFEALAVAERLEKLVMYLREKHWYCLWCYAKYDDQELDGCPGLDEDLHG